MATKKPEQGYLSITVPCDNEQMAFMVERLNGTRIAIRVGRLVLFFTYKEAKEVIEAVTRLMGTQAGGKRC